MVTLSKRKSSGVLRNKMPLKWQITILQNVATVTWLKLKISERINYGTEIRQANVLGRHIIFPSGSIYFNIFSNNLSYEVNNKLQDTLS